MTATVSQVRLRPENTTDSRRRIGIQANAPAGVAVRPRVALARYDVRAWLTARQGWHHCGAPSLVAADLVRSVRPEISGYRLAVFRAPGVCHQRIRRLIPAAVVGACGCGRLADVPESARPSSSATVRPRA